MKRPKVLILGAGAIGTYLACRLAYAADVTVLVRPSPQIARAVEAPSVRIVGGPDEGSATVGLVSSVDDAPPPDLVLLAVKGPDTEAAITPLVGRLAKDAVVLEVQNGVDRAEEINALLDTRQALGGAIYLECRLDAPRVVRYLSGPRRIVFGEPNGSSPTDRVLRVSELLTAAGVDHVTPDDVRPHLWRKFALVCAANALTAITGGTFGDVLALPRSRENVLGILEEVVAVGQAHGVLIPDGAPADWFAFLEDLGPSLRSSMLHDVERGRRTEVEQLNGTVVRLAAEADLDVPRNDLIALALRAGERRVPN